MDNKKFSKAKELLIKNYLLISNMSKEEKQEWDSYNIPRDILERWIGEDIDSSISEIYTLINKNNVLKRNDIEYIDNSERIFILLRFLLKEVSVYDLKVYYSAMIQLIKELDKNEYIIYLLLDLWEDNGYGLSFYKNFIQITKEIDPYTRDPNNFWMEGDYIGLLPKLYFEKEIKLFNELLDILCDYVINCGYNEDIIRTLLCFSYSINDQIVLDKVINAAKIYKKKFIFRYYPRSFLDDDYNLEIGHQNEFERMKQTYYCHSISRECFTNYKCSFNLITFLNNHGINNELVLIWEKEKQEYVLNILNNLDDYLNSHIVIEGNHTEKYQEFVLSFIKTQKTFFVSKCICYILFNKMDTHVLINEINTSIYKNNLNLVDFYREYMSTFYKENMTNKEYAKARLLEVFKEITETIKMENSLDVKRIAKCLLRLNSDKDFVDQIEEELILFSR